MYISWLAVCCALWYNLNRNIALGSARGRTNTRQRGACAYSKRVLAPIWLTILRRCKRKFQWIHSKKISREYVEYELYPHECLLVWEIAMNVEKMRFRQPAKPDTHLLPSCWMRPVRPSQVLSLGHFELSSSLVAVMIASSSLADLARPKPVAEVALGLHWLSLD